MNPDMFQSMAVLKYYDPKVDRYDFVVYDKWCYPTETERFDKMLEKQAALVAEGKRVLWVKTLALLEIDRQPKVADE